ncbi:MAG TPA: nitrate- and nitrite sensing domain-containing protein [Polyangiales bacterium]|nr:nitrate- and nitrite sensing domain-containing protein [Polyangiales bacterium]
MNFIGGLAIRAKVLLLAGIPVVGTLILAAVIAQHSRMQTAAANALGSIEDVAQLSVRISAATQSLQLERAHAALDEGGSFHDPPRAPTPGMSHQFEATDRAMQQLESFLGGRDLSALPARLARDLTRARAVTKKRAALHEHLAREQASYSEILTLYGEACDALINATGALTELSDDGELLRSISSLVALAYLTERASREHALLSYVFAAGIFPVGSFKALVTLTTERNVYEDTFRSGAHGDVGKRFEAAQKSSAARSVRSMREAAMQVTSDDLDVEPDVWFEAATQEQQGLHAVEQELLARIAKVASAKQDANHASVRFGWILSIAVVLASLGLAWLIAHGVTESIVGLSSAAAEVRRTNNFAIRARKTSSDELGTLTETFNEMLTMIEQRDRHLELQVTIDFSGLTYMNSATVAPLITCIKAFDGAAESVLVVFSDMDWQRTHVQCVRTISRTLKKVKIEVKTGLKSGSTSLT